MIVIDASIAIKWIRRKEEYAKQALFIQAQHIKEKETIIIPQLLFYEVANTLATKSDISPAYIEKGLNTIYTSDLTVASTDQAIVALSSRLAKKHNTSVYDMLYAVIAKKHKTILYTADDRFIKKTKFPFVHHVREVEISK